VPAGITQIKVHIVGGGGGSYVDGGSGAGGGYVVGEMGVTPGESLTIYVGAGGQGFSSGTNDPRGGTGSYISRGAIVLAGAGGGGGGGRTPSFQNGNAGGAAYGIAFNGSNGSTTVGGNGGNNFIEYLANATAYTAKNAATGNNSIIGMSARYFTAINDPVANYGFGGNLGAPPVGAHGVNGVVIIEW
jgi:hypothetical protein